MNSEKKLNQEEKNLSNHLFEQFMISMTFDMEEPKKCIEMALRYHCDLILLSEMLKEERYDQVKQIIDQAMKKIACLEISMELLD